MASIEKRIDSEGNTTYRVRVRLKGYPIQTATFARLTDAKKWAQSTESAIRERRHFKTSEAKRRTVAELIDRYTKEVMPNKKAGTQKDQRQQLQWWREKIGAYSLADLSPALVSEHRDKLLREPINDPGKPTKTRTPARVNRYLAVLSHAFTIAVREWQWLEDNPLRKVSKLKEPRGRVRFLSDDGAAPDGTTIEGERTRLLKACRESRSPDLYDAVVLALSTGARKMEILGLRWRQVDLKRGLIVLEDTKNDDRRGIPLAGHALEVMRKRAKVMRIDTDLVFPSPEKPKSPEVPWQPLDPRAAFGAALERAGIEDFRWHDLRHSAASYLAMNGASLPEIAEVLGHKTLQMVKRYSHLSADHTAGVVARMNAKIFGI